MKPHKHAELIKAWADGAVIQTRSRLGSPKYEPQWEDKEHPNWDAYEYTEYRIKPEPKPDVVEELTLYRNLAVPFGTVEMPWANPKHYYPIGNFRLIRDGETGELKSAEVLK